MLTESLIWLARHARALLAAGVFIGIALPDLASLLRPLLPAAVIGTLTAALLRLDWRRLAQQARRPQQALWLSAWQLLLSPLLVWLGAAGLGLPPSLVLVLVLQAAAPPIGSAPVFALLLGIDATLTVLATVLAVLLLPLTLTPLIAVLPEHTIEIDLLAFFLRVTGLVLAPFALAGLIRWLLGEPRLQRNDTLLSGLSVVLLVIFAIAVMDGVSAQLLADPQGLALLFILAWVMALLLHASAYFAFARAGFDNALSAALCSGNRNMGLMLAITAGSAGLEFSLYVGLAQIPMYFMPLLVGIWLQRSARRLP